MMHLQCLEHEEKFYSQGFAPSRKGHSLRPKKHKKGSTTTSRSSKDQDRPYCDPAAISHSHRKLFKKNRQKDCDWKESCASDNCPAVASAASSSIYGYQAEFYDDLVFDHDDWDYDITTYVHPSQRRSCTTYSSSSNSYTRSTPSVKRAPPPPPPNPMEMGLEDLRRFVANIADFTPEHYELLTRLHELDKVVVGTSDDVISKLQKMTFESILAKVAEGEEEFPGFTPECRICLDEYEATTSVLILPCGHFFHDDCVRDYLQKYNNTCPVCKKEVGCDGERGNNDTEDLKPVVEATTTSS